MTIYQEEMQRKAQHYGCITSYDEVDQLLLISHKGVHQPRRIYVLQQQGAHRSRIP